MILLANVQHYLLLYTMALLKKSSICYDAGGSNDRYLEGVIEISLDVQTTTKETLSFVKNFDAAIKYYGLFNSTSHDINSYFLIISFT